VREQAAAAVGSGGGAAGARVPREGRVRHVSAPAALEALVSRGGFTSCIIAAPKLWPAAILAQVLPLLAPSATFAVFSPWLQPLAEAMAALTASRSAVMMTLQESWLRPYQVLPGRTHPHMMLTTGGTGGYVLSGTSVAAGGDGDGGREEACGGASHQQRRGGGRGGRRGGGSRRR
jgi:tRNA (adenine-N(1)-)-methyltransferase non-catalytic subunit